MRMVHYLILGLIVGLGGCGPSGIVVTGSVTRDGQPLSAGSIAFEPTGELATKAASSTAKIENGSFATSADRPLAPGKYSVRISPAEATSGSSDGPVQFTPWVTEATVTEGGPPLSFDVPLKPKVIQQASNGEDTSG